MNNYQNNQTHFSNSFNPKKINERKIIALKKLKKIRPWNIASLILTIFASIFVVTIIVIAIKDALDLNTSSKNVNYNSVVIGGITTSSIIITLAIIASIMYITRIIIYIITVVYASEYNKGSLIIWSILALFFGFFGWFLGPIFEIVYLIKSKKEIKKNEQLLN